MTLYGCRSGSVVDVVGGRLCGVTSGGQTHTSLGAMFVGDSPECRLFSLKAVPSSLTRHVHVTTDLLAKVSVSHCLQDLGIGHGGEINYVPNHTYYIIT